MAVEIIECEQGTDEWRKARLGMPTASRFSEILAQGKGITRRNYMLELAGEIITQRPAEKYTSKYIERGKKMEPEAIAHYELITNNRVRRVGFIKNGIMGCSPDGLIDNNRAVEIKTGEPHVLAEYFLDGFHLRGIMPPEHKAQCQGVLLVAELDYIDLSIYCPGMDPFIVTASRDQFYLNTLAAEIRRFHAELHYMVDNIRKQGELGVQHYRRNQG